MLLACLFALTTTVSLADDVPRAAGLLAQAPPPLVVTPRDPLEVERLRYEVQQLQRKRIGLGLPVTLIVTGGSVVLTGLIYFLVGMTSGGVPLNSALTIIGILGMVAGGASVGFGSVSLHWRLKDREELKEDLEAARARLRDAEQGLVPVMPTGPAPSPRPAARLEMPLTTIARF